MHREAGGCVTVIEGYCLLGGGFRRWDIGDDGRVAAVHKVHPLFFASTESQEPVAAGASDAWPGTIGSGPQYSFIAPGLIDLQLNGCFGIDFNQTSLTAGQVHEATRKLWRHGVTTYYPTVITNTDDSIAQIVSTIAAACEEDELTALSIAGIHLEGPYLSMEDGARGAHDKQYICPPDMTQFARWQQASGGRIRLVTLSPEWEEAPAFIAAAWANGVTASIGHTSASPEQVRQAAQAGARMSTHLGNGAHLMMPRHPNYIWEQLADERIWTCAIADGFHLPASVLKVFQRAKPDRFVLVSDAVYLCGLAPGPYRTHIGGDVVLTPEGRLQLAADPRMLAGSAQLLPHGIAHMVRTCGLAPAEAWRAASLRPAIAMGLPQRHGLEPGAPADAVEWSWNEDAAIRIQRVWKAGRLVKEE